MSWELNFYVNSTSYDTGFYLFSLNMQNFLALITVIRKILIKELNAYLCSFRFEYCLLATVVVFAANILILSEDNQTIIYI